MYLLGLIIPFALVIGPIVAAPVATGSSVTYKGTVTCTATDITDAKKPKNVSWKVSVATAKAEMEKAGISRQGKTGYPHPYRNHQNLDWSVATCKKTNIDLLEYPVFWQRHAPLDNTRRTNEQAHSPIRVVYANDGGVMVYCGLMTHEVAKKEQNVGGQESWIGDKGFKICL